VKFRFTDAFEETNTEMGSLHYLSPELIKKAMNGEHWREQAMLDEKRWADEEAEKQTPEAKLKAEENKKKEEENKEGDEVVE